MPKVLAVNALVVFFFNDTATTEIYTLSYTTLFRSRPAQRRPARADATRRDGAGVVGPCAGGRERDRKSTRLNSSHLVISYAVFCLKQKKIIKFSLFLLKKKKKRKNIS